MIAGVKDLHYHPWLRIVLEQDWPDSRQDPLLKLKVCAIVPGSSSEILQDPTQDNFGFVSAGFCFETGCLPLA